MATIHAGERALLKFGSLFWGSASQNVLDMNAAIVDKLTHEPRLECACCGKMAYLLFERYNIFECTSCVQFHEAH